jgi:hypothetical protein
MEHQPAAARVAPSRWNRWLFHLALSVVLLASTAVRWHLLDVPLERDEGEYGYMAQLINQGVPPYVAAYNMKLPGTYAISAVFLRVFGDDAEAIRIGLLLTNAASIVLLYLLARPRMGETSGVAAALAFAAWTLSPTVLGTFAHATNFVVLFALAALVVLDRAQRSWTYVAAGLLFGLSILMKQNGIFFAAFAAGWIVWREWPAHRRAVTRVGLLALGAALPLALTALVLYRAGAWPRFWFWVVEYASAYVSQVGPQEAWDNLAFTGGPLLRTALILWLLVAAGLAIAVYDAWRSRRPTYLLVFGAVSAVAVCPGFWFRPHYFVLLLPAAALLIGLAVERGARAAAVRVSPAGAAVAGLAVVALGAAQSVYSFSNILFDAGPAEASRLIYDTCPFPESVEIAAYIRARTSPEERIAVIGSEPQIYFYAQRRAATGYLYTYPMMEPQPYAARMRDEMMDEIEAARPAYVVFVTERTSWMARKDSDQSIVKRAGRFLDAHYRQVGIVEIPEDRGPGYYYWDDALRSYKPRLKNRVIVLKRL